MLSSYNFQDVYEDMGVDWEDPGCVMLKTSPIFIDDVPEELLHYSSSQKYAQGHVSKDKPHVTLLYGLLPPVGRKHVDRVLEDWLLPDVVIRDIMVFKPQGQEYEVVVADVFGEELLNGHQRLSLLPHINTHLEYKPHLTLFYVEPGQGDRVAKMCRRIIGAEIPSNGIDYGDIK